MYCILTVENNESEETIITWYKDLHLFKDDAFDKAQSMGKNASVVELTQTNSWNHEQIQSTKPKISEEPLVSSQA